METVETPLDPPLGQLHGHWLLCSPAMGAWLYPGMSSGLGKMVYIFRVLLCGRVHRGGVARLPAHFYTDFW